MQIKLFAFKKRKNSTKLPTGTPQTVNFSYKDTSDYHNPTIILQGYDNTHTYAQIDNLYFFISSVKTIRAQLWEISLSIDLMATYRADIFNTSAFVSYSASANNTLLPDTRIPITGDIKSAVHVASFPWIDATLGIYAFTAISNASTSYSAFSTTYISGASTLFNVAQKMLFMDTDILAEMELMFTKPKDAVLGLKWMPIDYNTATTGTGAVASEIKLGKWGSNQFAFTATNKLISGSGSVDIPWIYDDWRNLTPYTEVTVHIPFYGAVPIEASKLIGQNKILYDYSVDVIAGEMAVNLSLEFRNMKIFQCNVNIGVDLPVGQASNQIGSGLASVGVALVSAATGNIAGVIGGLGSAFAAGMSRSYTGSGGISAGKAQAAISNSITCAVRTNSPTTMQMGSVLGNPLGTINKLANLSGYCQTVQASVTCGAFDIEINTINGTMDGGFYIE